MRLSSTLAFSAMLTLACLPTLQAQQNNQPPGGQKQTTQTAPPQNPFGPGSPLGGQLAPLMMSFGSSFGGTVDLSHSNAMNLLQRNDVRTELLITSPQREKLDEMKSSSQQELMQRVQTSAAENFQGIQNAPPEQRLDLVQQGLTKLQDTVQTYQNDLDKNIEKLLDRNGSGGVPQVERLRQLDLQFRGPLALSEKKLADNMKLTPDQRTIVSTALSEYVQVQGQAMMKAFSGMGPGAAGGPPGAGGAGFNPQEMQKKMTEAMQSEDIKKARKASEKKVTDAMTAEQKETWKSWLGKPFTFRINNS